MSWPEQVTRGDIAELHVADFVLGMLFVQPYMAFEDVFRGYGPEVSEELVRGQRGGMELTNLSTHSLRDQYGKELSAEARKSENFVKSSYVRRRGRDDAGGLESCD